MPVPRVVELPSATCKIDIPVFFSTMIIVHK